MHSTDGDRNRLRKMTIHRRKHANEKGSPVAGQSGEGLSDWRLKTDDLYTRSQ